MNGGVSPFCGLTSVSGSWIPGFQIQPFPSLFSRQSKIQGSGIRKAEANEANPSQTAETRNSSIHGFLVSKFNPSRLCFRGDWESKKVESEKWKSRRNLGFTTRKREIAEYPLSRRGEFLLLRSCFPAFLIHPRPGWFPNSSGLLLRTRQTNLHRICASGRSRFWRAKTRSGFNRIAAVNAGYWRSR